MDFSSMNPSTFGQTTGRMSNDTKHSACSSCVEVKGRRSNAAGGCSASVSNLPKTALDTAFLSSGIGRPPSAT